MFADRFDVDAPQPELRPGADITYNARNRDLRPDLGRWVQRDPNGTASAVVEAMAGHGGVRAPGVVGFDAEGLYQDGASLYAFGGADPLSGLDPFGLFDSSIIGLLGGASSLAELESDWTQDTLDRGQTLSMAVLGPFEEAAAAQIDDADWALDWDLADDDYSRSGRQADPEEQGEGFYDPRFGVAGVWGHHIMTNKNLVRGGRYTLRFIRLLREHKITGKMFSLNSADNLLQDVKWLAKHHTNKGAHSQGYHQWVFDEVQWALQGKYGDEALEALKEALGGIRDKLLKDGSKLNM